MKQPPRFITNQSLVCNKTPPGAEAGPGFGGKEDTEMEFSYPTEETRSSLYMSSKNKKRNKNKNRKNIVVTTVGQGKEAGHAPTKRAANQTSQPQSAVQHPKPRKKPPLTVSHEARLTAAEWDALVREYDVCTTSPSVAVVQQVDKGFTYVDPYVARNPHHATSCKVTMAQREYRAALRRSDISSKLAAECPGMLERKPRQSRTSAKKMNPRQQLKYDRARLRGKKPREEVKTERKPKFQQTEEECWTELRTRVQNRRKRFKRLVSKYMFHRDWSHLQDVTRPDAEGFHKLDRDNLKTRVEMSRMIAGYMGSDQYGWEYVRKKSTLVVPKLARPSVREQWLHRLDNQLCEIERNAGSCEEPPDMSRREMIEESVFFKGFQATFVAISTGMNVGAFGTRFCSHLHNGDVYYMMSLTYKLLRVRDVCDFTMVVNDIFADSAALRKQVHEKYSSIVKKYLKQKKSEEPDAERQAGLTEFMENLENDGKEGFEKLSQVTATVSALINSPLGAKFLDLCGMLVALGFLRREHLELTFNDVKVFSVPHKPPEKATVLTAIDALFKVIERGVRTVSQCYQEGSLLPLGYENMRMRNFEAGYLELKGLQPALTPGNLELLRDLTMRDYHKMTLATIELGEKCILGKVSAVARSVLEKKITELKSIAMTCEIQIALELGKIDPYVFNLYGGSGVGKSEMMGELVKLILENALGNYTPSMVAGISEEMSHDNTAMTSIMAYVADDLGNLTERARMIAASATLLKFTGMLMRLANKASLEQKETTLLNHILFAISANTMDFGAKKDSVNPGAIIRRVANVYMVKAMPFLTNKSTALDRDRITAWKEVFEFGSMGPVNVFHIQKAYVINGNNAEHRTVRVGLKEYPNTVAQLRSQQSRALQYCTEAKRIWPKEAKEIMEFTAELHCFPSTDGLWELSCIDYRTFQAYVFEDTTRYYAQQHLRMASKMKINSCKVYCARCNRPGVECICKPVAEDPVSLDKTDPEPERQSDVELTPVQFDQNGDPMISETLSHEEDDVSLTSSMVEVLDELDSDEPPREVRVPEIPSYRDPPTRRTFNEWVADTLPASFSSRYFFVRAYVWLYFIQYVAYLEELVELSLGDGRVDISPEAASNMFFTDVTWDFRMFGRAIRTAYVNSLQSEVARNSLFRAARAWKYRQIMTFSCLVSGSVVLPTFVFPFPWWFRLFIFATAFVMSYVKAMNRLRERVAQQIVRRSHDVLSEESLSKQLFDYGIFGGLLATVGMIAYTYSQIKPDPERQSVAREVEPMEVQRPFTYHHEENVPTVPSVRLEGMQPERLKDLVDKNLVNLEFHYAPEDGKTIPPQHMHALGVSGHLYLTLKHPFEKHKVVGISRYETGVTHQVYPFDTRDIYLYEGRDLAMFRFADFGSVGDLSDLFVSSEFKGGTLRLASTRKQIDDLTLSFDARYLPRATGKNDNSYPVGYFKKRSGDLSKMGSCVVSVEDKLCRFGDCGSTYVSFSGARRGIVGLHVAAVTEKKPTSTSRGRERLIYEPCTTQLVLEGRKALKRTGFEMPPTPPIERQMEATTPVMGVDFGADHHPHSPTYHLPPGAYVKVLGRCKKGRTLRSRVKPTYGADFVREEFGVLQEYGPPPMRFKEDGTPNFPYYVAIEQTCRANLMYVPEIDRIVEDYLKPIIPELTKVEEGVLTPAELLWGTGDGRLGSLKLSTSAGFGNVSPKREHFYEQDGRWYPSGILWTQFNEMDGLARSGKRVVHFWQATIKDEPVKLGADKKARAFMCPQMIYTMLLRKYFGRLLQFVYKRSRLTMFAYGENAVSQEWDDLLAPIRLKKYHGELDYKRFDQTTTSTTKAKVADVVLTMVKAFGTYSEEDLVACNTLLSEYVEMMIAYDGSLVLLPSGTPSGLLLTTLVNCIDNILRMGSAFYLITKSTTLRGELELRVHGDDVVYGTDDPRLTFGAFKNALAFLSTTVTPPGDNKNLANPPPFVPFEKMMFLSRTSVYHQALDCYVGALQETSLFKGLLVRVQGKHQTSIEHFIAASQSFIYEAFAHGPEKYEDLRRKLERVLSRLGLSSAVPQVHWTYAERVEMLSPNIPHLTQQELEEFCPELEPIYDPTDITDVWDDSSLVRDHPRAGAGIEPGCPEGEIRRESGISVPPALVDSLATTNTNQSTREGDGITTWFLGDNPENSVSITPEHDATRSSTATGSEVLSDILNRQFLVKRIQWTAATSFDTIDIWEEIFNNDVIRDKLSGFALFNGTIRLKFILNGVKFYSGRITASYFPLPNEFLPYHEKFRDDDQTLCLQSQMMHLHLDPSMSSAGEMNIPFMYDQASLSMQAGGYSALGLVHLNSVVPLSTVLTGNPVVGISVYACFEDIKLSVPTDLAVIRQSEIVDTKVSSRLRAVANFAALYDDVPFIAPYAKATEMASGTAASILSMFGFSKPPSQQTPGKYLKSYGESMSSAHSESNHITLAYNPKAEITVDPRVTGVGVPDELTIASIAGRDSHFARFEWSQLNNAGDALARYQVSPMLIPEAQFDINGKNKLALTSLAFASTPFTYWRGTLVFRIQTVGPQTVNGRYRIVHHPTACGDDPPYNVLRSVLVDITETRDVEFCVPWVRGKDYLEVGGLITNHPNVAEFLDEANGQIGIFVENELVGPDEEVPQITFLVSVRAEEFQVFEPTMDIIKTLDVIPDRVPVNDAYPPTAIADQIDDLPLDDLVAAVRNAGDQSDDDDDPPIPTVPAQGPPPGQSDGTLWITDIDNGLDGRAGYDGPNITWENAAVTGKFHVPVDGLRFIPYLSSTRGDRVTVTTVDGTNFTRTANPEGTERIFFRRDMPAGVYDFGLTAVGGNNNLRYERVRYQYANEARELHRTYREESLEHPFFGFEKVGEYWRMPANFFIQENVGSTFYVFAYNSDQQDAFGLVLENGAGPELLISGLAYVAYRRDFPIPDPQRQSGGEAEAEATEEPTHTCDMQANPIPVHLHSVFHDDPLVSLRTMLKREYPTGTIYLEPGQNEDIRPMYPLFRLSGDQTLPTKPNLFSYITMPFAAMRGGMRWTLIPVSGTARSIAVSRGETGIRRETPATVSGNAGSIAGAEVFPFDSCARVTIPYYFPVRFLRPITFTDSNITTKFSVRTTVTSRDVGAIDLYTSIAEDFALVNWRGPPFLYT